MKKFNADDIMREFQENSSFFRKKTDAAPSPALAPEKAIQEDSPPLPEVEGKADTTIPRNHDTMVDTVIPRHHDITSDTKSSRANVANPLLERTRRAVKHFGKEAATYRFTSDEKRGLKKIENDYALKGIRTSENQITRIAINYLLEEYRQNKDTSILAEVLELLNS